MADITVTPANVTKTDGSTTDGVAGEAINAGQVVYLDTAVTPNVYKLAQADGTAIQAGAAGIALNTAALNQPVRVQTSGTINPGGTVAIGQVYAVSAAFGGIAPYADLVSTNRVCLLGVGMTASTLKLSIFDPVVQKA